MKKIIIAVATAVAILSGNAYAAGRVLNAYTTPNDAGGKIMVIDAQCPAANGKVVLSTAANDFVLQQGCAEMLNDNQVAVRWTDQSVYVFPTSKFELKTITIE